MSAEIYQKATHVGSFTVRQGRNFWRTSWAKFVHNASVSSWYKAVLVSQAKRTEVHDSGVGFTYCLTFSCEPHSRIMHLSSLCLRNQYCFVPQTDWSIVHKFASRCLSEVSTLSNSEWTNMCCLLVDISRLYTPADSSCISFCQSGGHIGDIFWNVRLYWAVEIWCTHC